MVFSDLTNRFSGAAKKAVRHFVSNEEGVMAIYVALILATIVGCSGAYIDYHRARSAKNEMQLAMDQAILTVARKTLTGGGAERDKIGNDVFKGGLSEAVKKYVYGSDPLNPKLATQFIVKQEKNDDGEMVDKYIEGYAKGFIPLYFGRLFGTKEWEVNIFSRATIAPGLIRNGDFVFVIDASDSMQDTITAVKNNALSFRKDMDNYLIAQNYDPLDGMRIRVIFFRDFLNYFIKTELEGAKGVSCNNVCLLTLLGETSPGSGIPRDENQDVYPYFAPTPWGPIEASEFYDLDSPNDPQAFHDFVASVPAVGGGDAFEFSLQAIHVGTHSQWLKPRSVDGDGKIIKGDIIEYKGLEIQKTFRVLVIWTDQGAYPLPIEIDTDGNAVSSSLDETAVEAWKKSGILDFNAKLQVSGVASSKMPDNYDGLITNWKAMATTNIEPIIVTFMNADARGADGDCWYTTNYPCENGFAKTLLKSTGDPQFTEVIDGGTVAVGNAEMIKSLADAVKEIILPPKLVPPATAAPATAIVP